MIIQRSLIKWHAKCIKGFSLKFQVVLGGIRIDCTAQFKDAKIKGLVYSAAA